jgi:hypothetical protein
MIKKFQRGGIKPGTPGQIAKFFRTQKSLQMQTPLVKLNPIQ